MTNVNDLVAARIRAAVRRRQQRRRQRAEFEQARAHGLEARRRNKLRHTNPGGSNAR